MNVGQVSESFSSVFRESPCDVSGYLSDGLLNLSLRAPFICPFHSFPIRVRAIATLVAAWSLPTYVAKWSLRAHLSALACCGCGGVGLVATTLGLLPHVPRHARDVHRFLERCRAEVRHALGFSSRRKLHCWMAPRSPGKMLQIRWLSTSATMMSPLALSMVDGNLYLHPLAVVMPLLEARKG